MNWSCFNTNSKNKRHMLLVWNLTCVIVTVSFLSRRYKKNDTFKYYLNMKTDQKYSCCFKIKCNCWLRRQVALLSLTWSCERVFRTLLTKPTPRESFSNVTVSVACRRNKRTAFHTDRALKSIKEKPMHCYWTTRVTGEDSVISSAASHREFLTLIISKAKQKIL